MPTLPDEFRWAGVDADGPRWTVEVDWATALPDLDLVNSTQVRLPDGSVVDVNLSLEVVLAAGPGGGWPVVRVSGEPADLVAFLAEYHDDDGLAALLARCAACGERIWQAERAETARGVVHQSCMEPGEALA